METKTNNKRYKFRKNLAEKVYNKLNDYNYYNYYNHEISFLFQSFNNILYFLYQKDSPKISTFNIIDDKIIHVIKGFKAKVFFIL